MIVHLKNTAVSGVSKHPNRTSTEEYHWTGSGWDVVNYPHISTSSTYGHWVCVVGYDAAANPANLSESDFFAPGPGPRLGKRHLCPHPPAGRHPLDRQQPAESGG